jgi:hypothetical protein
VVEFEPCSGSPLLDELRNRNLTRLPLADGATLDLREKLADGLLDVVVQGNIAVEGIWLRVLR